MTQQKKKGISSSSKTSKSKEILILLGVFILTILLIRTFWEQSVLLTTLLLAVFIGANLLWYKKNDYIIYVIGFILGSTLDISIVHNGAWTFNNPDIFGIPMWLPIAWIIGAMVLLKGYQAINK